MTISKFIQENNLEEIPFKTEFHNGVGYFYDAFKHTPEVPDRSIVTFTDDTGRKAVMFKQSEYLGIIIHQRYAERDDILVFSQVGYNFQYNALALEHILSTSIFKLLALIKSEEDFMTFRDFLNVCFADS